MYVYIYIYIYVYLVCVTETVRTFFNGFRRRHHPTFLFMVFVVGCFMVSVVAGNAFFLMVSVVGFLMVSVVAGKTNFVLMVPVLAAASEIIFDSSQIRDCAGDTRARSDSDTVTRSPATKDPDLTSGLCGFNPGRARFQGNCVCLLLACCLCLFVFVCFCSFPSQKAMPRSRAEKQCYVSCFGYVSVAFPLRFRGAPPHGPCSGASVKEASIREQ